MISRCFHKYPQDRIIGFYGSEVEGMTGGMAHFSAFSKNPTKLCHATSFHLLTARAVFINIPSKGYSI